MGGKNKKFNKKNQPIHNFDDRNMDKDQFSHMETKFLTYSDRIYKAGRKEFYLLNNLSLFLGIRFERKREKMYALFFSFFVSHT